MKQVFFVIIIFFIVIVIISIVTIAICDSFAMVVIVVIVVVVVIQCCFYVIIVCGAEKANSKHIITVVVLSINHRITFHDICGQHVKLDSKCRTAQRVDGYNHGVVMSKNPLPNDQLFQVRQLQRHWDRLTIHSDNKCYTTQRGCGYNHEGFPEIPFSLFSSSSPNYLYINFELLFKKDLLFSSARLCPYLKAKNRNMITSCRFEVC